MAKIVLKCTYVSIDGNDLTSYFENMDLNVTTDLPEATTFCDNTHNFLTGLKDWTFSGDFKSDYSSGALDEILWNIFDAGDSVPVEFRASSDAVSTSNPKYTATAVIESYSPISGAISEIAGGSLSLRPSEPSPNLTRATS